MSGCKICKSKDVVVAQTDEVISYKCVTLNVPMAYSICLNCNREFITVEQILQNDKAIRDAKKAHDGLFTSVEIAKARKQLGLTQEQASLVFGGGRNAFSKYERCEVSQSVAMDKLIKQALKHPMVLHDLLVEASIAVDKDHLIYKDDNLVPYEVFKAANDHKYKSVKSMKMQEEQYG
jgi:HTH-type transcriptional regulator/antitoxin MqsA